MEDKKLNNSLEQSSRLVVGDKDFITSIYRIPIYNDEPKLFAYSASYKSIISDSENVASGVSFQKKKALIRVLGEALERYCLDNFNEKNFTIGRISKLHGSFLHPSEVISFSKQQLQRKSFQKFVIKSDSKLRWVEGFSLPFKHKVLIPAQLVYTSYQNIEGEVRVRLPISTGAAAGRSLRNAIYTGICEVVERDAFMISYLNKLSSSRVDLTSIADEEIKRMINILHRYKLELVVIEITTDTQIPVFMAIILDKTGAGPAVSVGLKAGFNIKETLIGAIEESLMVRSWQRDMFIYSNSAHKIPKVIKTLEDRAYFWFKQDTSHFLNFWLKSKNLKRLNLEIEYSDKNEFNLAITLLKKARGNVFYVDITHLKMKKLGFTVVKVIIPQLHPLYLDERYPYFGGSRLYEVPIKLGFKNSPKQENQLNKIPHPFL